MFLKLLFLFVSLNLLPGPLFGQPLDKLLLKASNPPVTLTYKDSIQIINLLSSEKKVKPVVNREYFWYSSNKLKSTQGGFAGKLADGDFTVFNSDKDLLVKGKFKKGLKSGTWLQWYNNGNIKLQEDWRKGVRNGAFTIFAMDGTLKSKGNYKNGKLHGKVSAFTNGKEQIIRYKNGQLIEKEDNSVFKKIYLWPSRQQKKIKDSDSKEKAEESKLIVNEDKGKLSKRKLRNRPDAQKDQKVETK